MTHEDEQAVLAALKALAGETAGLQAPPAVEDAVIRGFRARQGRRRVRSRWVWVPGAVAAGLALLAWFGTRPPEIAPMPGMTAALHFSPPVVPVPLARVAPPIETRPVVKRPRRKEPVPGPTVPAAPVEVATDFLPLQPAPMLSREEPLQVVRISLPRTEMLRFGLPVSPGPRDARVKADVVLSEDGIARAIRFVR